MKCAVIRSGAWGNRTRQRARQTTPARATTIWAYEPDVADAINEAHENPRFLPGVSLHPEMRATIDKEVAVSGAEVVVFATPSHVLRDIAGVTRTWLPAGATLVVATKGIEREKLALMTDVIAEEFPGHSVVALSGPSFAAEVAARQPSAIVAASADASAAVCAQQVLSSPSFRVYTHDDVIGVELGGALKNVMAVATGISDGLGLGFNARAALITRGLAEIMRLGTGAGRAPGDIRGVGWASAIWCSPARAR